LSAKEPYKRSYALIGSICKYIIQRLEIRKRALCIRQRALNTRKRALISPIHTQRGTVSSTKKPTSACTPSLAASADVTHRLGFNYTSALSTRKRALIIRKRALQTHLRPHRQHLPIHHPKTRVRGISQKNPTYAPNSHDYVQKSPTNAPAPSSAASANTPPKDSGSWKFAKEPYSSPKKP